MRERALAATALLLVLARPLAAADVQPPAARGWVTDEAGVLAPAEEARLRARIEGLRARTGAEIAVVTVRTTAPLDDFGYAMRIAEAWKPGREGRDTGVVFLVATEDRKLRVFVGYGLEGILPDGLVGQIQDREVVPEFRAGRVGAGIVRGVEALADRIERGLAGEEAPPPRARRGVPAWVILLVVLVVVALMLYEARNGARRFRGRRRWGGPPIVWPGGFGGGRGGFDGFGGGGGGFGGFGGGRFGGGGAGRSW